MWLVSKNLQKSKSLEKSKCLEKSESLAACIRFLLPFLTFWLFVFCLVSCKWIVAGFSEPSNLGNLSWWHLVKAVLFSSDVIRSCSMDSMRNALLLGCSYNYVETVPVPAKERQAQLWLMWEVLHLPRYRPCSFGIALATRVRHMFLLRSALSKDRRIITMCASMLCFLNKWGTGERRSSCVTANRNSCLNSESTCFLFPSNTGTAEPGCDSSAEKWTDWRFNKASEWSPIKMIRTQYQTQRK